jgi:hypothetical protein
MEIRSLTLHLATALLIACFVLAHMVSHSPHPNDYLHYYSDGSYAFMVEKKVEEQSMAETTDTSPLQEATITEPTTASKEKEKIY